jgi:hypothetical protein
MTHQCPKCELRFTWPTELEDHCRSDHPEFHHDYPASVRHDYSARAVRVGAGKPVHSRASDESAEGTSRILSTYWNER